VGTVLYIAAGWMLVTTVIVLMVPAIRGFVEEPTSADRLRGTARISFAKWSRGTV